MKMRNKQEMKMYGQGHVYQYKELSPAQAPAEGQGDWYCFKATEEQKC